MDRIVRPRLINLYAHKFDAGLGKTVVGFREIPGLTLFANIGGGEARGAFTTTSGACYAAVGSTAYRVQSNGTFTALGTLLTSTGPVEMDANTDQVCMVDGPYGYVTTLATDAFAQLTSGAFYGSKTLCVIDGYGMFVRDGTGQFYITGINDFTALDALDFATSEGSPDNGTAILADHRQARVFGTHTTEGWFNSGDPDFPFSRDQSSYSQIGTSAPYSARLVSNSVCFIGQSTEGNGVVYMATGNTVERISTHEIEEALKTTTDITAARGYAYQDDGHLFYVINAPGLSTTLVFDVATREWHERAEVVDGAYAPHRATCHTYAFGNHIVGDSTGKLYRFDRSVYTNNGDVLSRERIYPQNPVPAEGRQYYGCYELHASRGDAPDGAVPLVSLRYSNDGGNTWQGWRDRELGRTGEFKHKAYWISNGSAFDRVWHERCADNAPFSIFRSKVSVNG